MSRLVLPQTRISKIIDPVIIGIGQTTSWLWLLLLFVIVTNVVLRYAFGEGRIEFEEFQWPVAFLSQHMLAQVLTQR